MKDQYEILPFIVVGYSIRYGEWREEVSRHGGKYHHRYAQYHRAPKTFNEVRQLRGMDADGLPIRRRRLNVPSAYDDVHLGRNYGKSWKDFTKQRRQWA